jgi:hypothetical protein
MKLTPTEAQHIETLRSLSDRRFNAVLVFAESLAPAPTAEETGAPAASVLRLVVNNEGGR